MWIYTVKPFTYFFKSRRLMRDYPAGRFYSVPRHVARKAIDIGAAELVKTPRRGQEPSRGD